MLQKKSAVLMYSWLTFRTPSHQQSFSTFVATPNQNTNINLDGSVKKCLNAQDWVRLGLTDVLKRSPVGKIRLQSGHRALQVVSKTVKNDNPLLTHRFSRTLDFDRQYHVLARIYPPRSMNKPHEIRENFKKTHLRNKTQRHSQKMNKKQ